MNTENTTTQHEYYYEHAINVCSFVLNLVEDFNQEEKCTCHLHDAFLNLSTAIWIFENCDEDLIIEHQMIRVDEIENEVLELNSGFDHNHLH